ncbi:MAG: GNAT family N-acetyltransferase [Candidatus Devosia euplotis]|nr:GNAT family N-acetyltransferase [Candidatus Devosia euplotis]
MIAIPSLTTERLHLRPPVYDDFLAYAALMQSDRASYMGGPFDQRAAWGMFCNNIAQWPLFGHGCLMLELIATGQRIGQVGINHGPLFPEKELSWLLYAGHEVKGCAFEAASAMRDWAFATLQLPSLVSYTDPGNTASIALARRLGGVRDDLALGQDPEGLVFRHWPDTSA